MQLNSSAYLIFFPSVVAIYYILPHTARWLWLLAASLLFCMTAAPWFTLPLLAVIIVEYCMGLLIERGRRNGSASPKIFLVIGILFPLSLLVLFKYTSFFNDAAYRAAALLSLHYPTKVLRFIIPLGISYYSFQSISYIIEMSRGTIRAERHFGIFALYLLFFPKIIAGPIERPSLIQQFRELHDCDYLMVTNGIKIMAGGFFKKLVIADRVAIVVNEVYGHPDSYHGIYFLLATLLFAVQIYCDFSGYTDIAIGSARVLGFRLMDNFRRPYGAASLSEFWRRWHISLTAWLRDYLYIPLGGNRAGTVRWYRNIFVTFLLSGLWHGANWTFIAWGAVHGLLLMFGMLTRNIRLTLTSFIRLDRAPRLLRLLRIAGTCTVVCFAWIFFRADSLRAAIAVIRKIIAGTGDILASLLTFDTVHLQAVTDIARNNTILGFSRETYRPEMLIAALSIISLWIFNSIQERKDVWEALSKQAACVRWSAYALMMMSLLFFGMFTQDQFIYFRF